jgi:hypothetical protein
MKRGVLRDAPFLLLETRREQNAKECSRYDTRRIQRVVREQ